MEPLTNAVSQMLVVTMETTAAAANWTPTEAGGLTTEEYNSETGLKDIWCNKKLTVPFLNPCYGSTMQVGRIFATIIPTVGIILNIISLLVLTKMKMNAESLFLMKSLTVYDSAFLITWLCIFPPRYLVWVAGLGDIQYTAYHVFFQIVYCVYRISLSMAFWLVCLITTHR